MRKVSSKKIFEPISQDFNNIKQFHKTLIENKSMSTFKPLMKETNEFHPIILTQTPKNLIHNKRMKNNISTLTSNNGTTSLKTNSGKFLINTGENSNMNISHNIDDNISPKNIINYKDNISKKGICLKKRNNSNQKNRRNKDKSNEKFCKKIQKEIKKEIKKESNNNSFLTVQNLKKIIFIQRWWRTISCIILIQKIFRGFLFRFKNMYKFKIKVNKNSKIRKRNIPSLIHRINIGKKLLNSSIEENNKIRHSFSRDYNSKTNLKRLNSYSGINLLLDDINSIKKVNTNNFIITSQYNFSVIDKEIKKKNIKKNSNKTRIKKSHSEKK